MLEWVAISSSRDIPDPGIKPRSPTLQADALPSKPPGKMVVPTLNSLQILYEEEICSTFLSNILDVIMDFSPFDRKCHGYFKRK